MLSDYAHTVWMHTHAYTRRVKTYMHNTNIYFQANA